MMAALFWSSVGLVAYVYLGYPVAIWALAAIRNRSVRKHNWVPNVSIVIAAYNEEQHIGATIENKLSLDYPREKLEIIVVSDESTDQTDRIVRRYAEAERGTITLLRQVPRCGKTSALNMAMRHVRGEIVVFSDANSIYGRDALRALVRNFRDPSVGYVTGKMVYVTRDGSIAGDGCSAFMKYENFLRFHETRVNSVVGVDGGIDAVRASLYSEMRPDQLPDFVLPLSVVKHGFRVVYEPEALLKEEALADLKDEYRMRVRVALRAFWALYDMRGLFNPLRYGIFSWQLLSHKALRYLTFVPLVIAVVANAMLLREPNSLLYKLTFLGQALLYGLAVSAKTLEQRRVGNAVSAFAHYFALVNVASGHAFWKFLRGEKKSIWKPRTG